MAKNPDAGRIGERGLSLIEALVIVTITALLALLLLPMVSRAAGRNFGMADSAIDDANATVAESEFRVLMRASVVRRLEGDRAEGVQGQAGGVIVLPSLANAVSCAREGAPQFVRIRISGDRLICESDGGRRREVLRWARGQARFDYSADGRSWGPTWADAGVAPLVRFQLSLPDGRELTWIEQAGAAEPGAQERAP